MLYIVLMCFAVAIAIPISEPVRRFDNYQLISVLPNTETEVQILRDLEGEGLDSEYFDFWSSPSLKHKAELLVAPETAEKITRYLKIHGMTPTVEVPNIQTLLDNANKKSKSASPLNLQNRVVDHTVYHSLAEIDQYLRDFEATYGGMARVGELPSLTYENKKMYYLEISTNNFAQNRQAILVEAGIHAREWISPASVLYIFDQLLWEHSTDPNSVLNKFDWYVIFVANPDGYEYSRNNNRLWRKNRVNRGGSCFGVDLNRNFDAYWGTAGTSTSCSSDTFGGPAKLSEAESLNIESLAAHIQQGGTRLKAFISVHSYSQLLLVPYAYKLNERPPHSHEHDQYAAAAVDALKSIHGKVFTMGTAPDLLYEASGSSADWAILRASVKYAYTYELRPRTAFEGGFVLPERDIIPSGEELYASFVSLAESFDADDA